MDASHKAPEPPACIAQGTENRCEAVHTVHRDRCRFPHGRAALQVSVLAADCFGRPRKKTPAICDGSSFGRNAASQSQRRKLTTFRPVRLWLFTHSTAAIGGPKSRDHAVNGRSGLGRCQLAETVMSARLWLRFSNNSATRAHLLEQIDGLGADLTPERGLPRPASPKSSVARPSAAAHFHKTKMRGVSLASR
jgi:hypothetical protein